MRVLPFLLLSGLLFAAPGWSGSSEDIPIADNLSKIGKLTRQQNIPAVIFVTREACPYCRTLRTRILQPMLDANKFEHRAILVEVNLDRQEPMTGFDNIPITTEAFARHYRAEITPTLLFLDAEGHEVTKRLVGISNLEFYSHYLQSSIDRALLEIRSGKPRG